MNLWLYSILKFTPTWLLTCHSVTMKLNFTEQYIIKNYIQFNYLWNILYL